MSVSFDDLIPKSQEGKSISFDDLILQKQKIPQGNAGGAARAVAYGLSGGQVPFGNVITSGIGAGIAKIASPITGDQRSYGKMYDQAQADTKATRQANPSASIVGNILGIGSTLPIISGKAIGGVVGKFGDKLIPQATKGLINAIPQGLAKVDNFVRGGKAAADAGTLAKTGSFALRMGKGAVVAAPVGGLYGAGEADSGERGNGFVSGATTSAVIGGALPVAGKVLAPIFTKAEEAIAKKVIQSKLAGAPVADDLANSAFDKVVARLKADFPDPQDFQDVLNKFTYGNKSLAELSGERTTNLAKGAAQYPSGEAVTKELFLPRVGEAPDNIKRAVSNNISKKTDYYTTLEDLLSQGQAKAKPLYDEAYKFNKSIASKEIDNILSTPAGKKALSDARIIMQNDRSLMSLPDKELGDLARELQQMGLMSETKGGVASGLKLRTLDYVKKALDDQYQTAVRAGEKSNARAILGLKQGLVQELDGADKTGLYAKARKTAGDYLSSEKAMEDGVNYKKIDAPLIQRQIAKMTSAEKNAFKVGVVKSIRDDIDAVTGDALGGGNVYQRVFGKPSTQNRLKEILGNDYLKLEKELLAEDKIYKIRNEVLANSATAGKQKAAQEFENIAQGYVTDVATMGATAGTTATAIKATKMFIGKMFDGISDKTAGDVAKILFTTDKSEKIKMINSIRKAAVTPDDRKALEAYFTLSDVLKKTKNVIPKSSPLRITVGTQKEE